MDDDERWAAAERRAAGEDAPARRRRNRRALLGLIVLGVGYGVVTALVREALVPEPSAAPGPTEPLTALFWIGGAISAVGLLGSAAGAVLAVARGRLALVHDRVEAPLSRRQRRRVGRMLRGVEPIPVADRPVVVAIAEQRRAAFRALVPVYAGIVLLIVGAALAFADLGPPVPLLVVALGVVALAAVAVDWTVQTRPASRFLAAGG